MRELRRTQDTPAIGPCAGHSPHRAHLQEASVSTPAPGRPPAGSRGRWRAQKGSEGKPGPGAHGVALEVGFAGGTVLGWCFPLRRPLQPPLPPRPGRPGSQPFPAASLASPAGVLLREVLACLFPARGPHLGRGTVRVHACTCACACVYSGIPGLTHHRPGAAVLGRPKQCESGGQGSGFLFLICHQRSFPSASSPRRATENPLSPGLQSGPQAVHAVTQGSRAAANSVTHSAVSGHLLLSSIHFLSP